MDFVIDTLVTAYVLPLSLCVLLDISIDVSDDFVSRLKEKYCVHAAADSSNRKICKHTNTKR